MIRLSRDRGFYKATSEPTPARNRSSASSAPEPLPIGPTFEPISRPTKMSNASSAHPVRNLSRGYPCSPNTPKVDALESSWAPKAFPDLPRRIQTRTISTFQRCYLTVTSPATNGSVRNLPKVQRKCLFGHRKNPPTKPISPKKTETYCHRD